MSNPIVWVYLVRGRPTHPEAATREDAALFRDFEEKGLPVILDNPYGEGLRLTTRAVLQAGQNSGNPSDLAVITEARLLGKSLFPSSSPNAFPKETR